jgi:hypothetical protein
MYMVAFLHTKHRVTFRAAALILICLSFIFSALVGDFTGAIATPRTLKTVFAKFNIKDNFVVHPVCFHCHFIFEPNTEPEFCPDCDEEVLSGPDQNEDNSWENADTEADEHRSNPPRAKKRKPYMVAPIQLLSTGLREFFKRPGMVSAVESWRSRPRVDGELHSMQDADVWSSMKDAEGQQFFFGPHSEKEIRVGVSYSLDWYVLMPDI